MCRSSSFSVQCSFTERHFYPKFIKKAQVSSISLGNGKMTVRIFLAIFLATLKISFGRENASNLGEATWEVHNGSFARETSNLKRRFPAEKRYTQLRECFKQGLHQNPIKLLKLSDIFPLKSQQRLLHKEFLRNATRNVELFNQSLKLEPLYHKALQGKDINIAIIGGSNAAGGNLEQDEKNIEGIFYNLFATWWNATMGNWTGSHAIIHNVAISSLGSYLFAFCYETFLPVGVDVDLFVVEQSVNFQAAYKSAPLETLIRQILKRMPRSNIVFVNFVVGLGKDPKTEECLNPDCTNLEDYGQLDVAHRYRIVAFCVKDLFCKRTNGGGYKVREKITEVSRVIASDLYHPGALTHAQVGLLMINYFSDVFVNLTENKLGYKGDFDHEVRSPLLPAPIYKVRDRETLINPQCWITLTPNACNRHAQHPNLDMRIEENKGFRFYDSFVQKPPPQCNGMLRKDLQRGWGSKDKNNFMKFHIFVEPWNSESVSGHVTSRSVIIVLRAAQRIGGQALIWLDNDKEKAIKVDNIVEFGNHLFTVARRVCPGSHTVSILTISDGFFIISGLLVGPPEFIKNGAI